jgi:hypothetical protein
MATSHFIGSDLSQKLASSMQNCTSSILYSTLRMASLCAHGYGTPFTILMDNDGNVEVHERTLNAKFHFEQGSICIEEEVLSNSGKMVETNLQLKLRNDEVVVWYLCSGTYRVFRLIASQMATSTIFLTPKSATSTVQVPNVTEVNVEFELLKVTLLIDSNNVILPLVKLGDISAFAFGS